MNDEQQIQLPLDVTRSLTIRLRDSTLARLSKLADYYSLSTGELTEEVIESYIGSFEGDCRQEAAVSDPCGCTRGRGWRRPVRRELARPRRCGSPARARP